jgi:sterol desaturase/sphingolipid hydroxylase (fatty acid hydroxylase superfamily)
MNSPLNPKDSMKSTWRRDKSQWSLSHKIFEFVDLYPTYLDKEIPVHSKDEQMPCIPDYQMQKWIIFHACIPLLAHQLFVHLTGQDFHPIIAFVYYYQASRLLTIREMRSLRKLGHKYGFLDGDQHERDGVPDVAVGKTLVSVFLAGVLRPLFTVYLAYNQNEPPASLNWKWLFIEISLYGIVVDFWFYWYHRLMHEVSGLWKYHRTHHLTKHPNPLLTIFADSEQEFFDIVGIPLMAWITMKSMGFPMGFYEWHISQLYVLFAEILGHSGLRLHACAPNPMAWLMRAFDADLTIEDHDLHHRKGWRKSHNYGKQTRIWDRVFGTCGERIESVAANVDFENKATMPVF